MTIVGTNTANNTAVVATTAPPTSCIVFLAASFGERPSSSMIRIVLSVTMMASSTTMPMARIKPNSVRLLMESPVASNTENVPISDTGIANAGTRVVRKSCKKMYTTNTTSRIATIKLLMTSLIDCRMYRVEL